VTKNTKNVEAPGSKAETGKAPKPKGGLWRGLYSVTFKPVVDITVGSLRLLLCLKEHREVRSIFREFISSCKQIQFRKPADLSNGQTRQDTHVAHLDLDHRHARQMLHRMKLHTWCISIGGAGIAGLLIYQKEWATVVGFLVVMTSLMAVNLWRQSQLRTLQQKPFLAWITRR